jgi:hypothetical protein
MGLEVGFWEFWRGSQVFQDFIGYRWEKGIVIWWACEQEREPTNRSKKTYSNYIPSMSIGIFLIDFDDMSKYTLTKICSTTSTKTHMSSLPCGSTTWTFDNNVFVQSNVSTKIYQGWCPMCWSKKMSLVHFLRILPLGFILEKKWWETWNNNKPRKTFIYNNSAFQNRGDFISIQNY